MKDPSGSGEIKQRELAWAEKEAHGDLEETSADQRQPGLVSTCPGTSGEYSCRNRTCSQIRKELEFYSGSKGQVGHYKAKALGDVGLTILS